MLVGVADDLDVDSSRFFENYHLKDQIIKFGNEPLEFKTRDLLCEFSILLQKFYGTDIWGQMAIKNIENYLANVVLIDDLRRPDEYEVIKKHFGARLITVYLDKVDVENKQVNANLPDAAKAFESKLNKEDMDIQILRDFNLLGNPNKNELKASGTGPYHDGNGVNISNSVPNTYPRVVPVSNKDTGVRTYELHLRDPNDITGYTKNF
jgi:hypothetical protein